MKSRRDILSLIGRNATGLAAAATFGPAIARAQSAEPDIFKGPGMAMHGAPKYEEGFTHFDYVNPNAPKGGSIFHGTGPGTFDSFNPFILQGTPVAYIGTVFDTTYKEGDYLMRPGPARGGSQSLDLQPAQGGFVEFTMDEPGLYPFVTHKFVNTTKGALGLFQAGEVAPTTAAH